MPSTLKSLLLGLLPASLASAYLVLPDPGQHHPVWNGSLPHNGSYPHNGTQPGHNNSTKMQNAVYFTSWGVYEPKGFKPANLSVDEITYALYSFANLQTDGTIFASDPWADYQMPYPGDEPTAAGNAYGNIKQLYQLKKANRHFKVLLSIGGWTYRANFTEAASTAQNRIHFARSAVALMTDWGMDGIDIDWEGPSNREFAASALLGIQNCADPPWE